MNRKNGALPIIVAGILWGIISIFIRNISGGGLSSLQICFVRMLVASVSFAIFVLIKDRNAFRIRLKDVWMFIGTGIISVTLFNAFYFYTMINAEASLAVVLLYTSPVFIMLLSRIIFKEKITAFKLLALVLTLAGCVLVTGLLQGGINVTSTVIITGLCAGLFYALYTIFSRFALKRYSSLTITVYTFIFGLFGSLFIGKPVDTLQILAKNPTLIFWCIGVGIICTVLPYVFYTMGLARIDSSKASILVAVEPLVGALIGMLLYKESHSPLKLLGIAFILASIIILGRSDGKSE